MASRLSVASPIGSGDQNELKEIHVKMSKKIAQLTKGKNHNIFFFQILFIKNYRKIMFSSVIYQLNTKNEDNDQKIKYLTETHAKQIEDLKTSSIKNSSPPEDSIELSKVLLNFTGLIASNNHQIISLMILKMQNVILLLPERNQTLPKLIYFFSLPNYKKRKL